MSKISQYIIDTLPTVSDYIVGTDAETLQTRNYKIGKIVDLQAIKPTGSFYSNSIQTGTGASGQPQVVSFPFSDVNATNQWSVVSNSRLTPQVAGLYNFDFTFFISLLTGSANFTAYFWLRKNGTANIDNSAVGRYVSITSLDQTYNVSANYSIQLVVGDYIEVLWQTTASSGVSPLLFPRSTVFSGGPSMPSASVTINKI